MVRQVLLLIMWVFVLAAAVYAPIRTRKVRDGWKPKRFKGTHEEFGAKYRRQFANRAYAWLWLGVGTFVAAITLLSIAFSDDPDFWWDFWRPLLIGGAFLTLGGVTFRCRRMLDSPPRARAATPEGEEV